MFCNAQDDIWNISRLDNENNLRFCGGFFKVPNIDAAGLRLKIVQKWQISICLWLMIWDNFLLKDVCEIGFWYDTKYCQALFLQMSLIWGTSYWCCMPASNRSIAITPCCLCCYGDRSDGPSAVVTIISVFRDVQNHRLIEMSRLG